ncbi:hypothetical protein GCM10020255_071730 [Rhodococcus baikonurensis]
MVVVLPVTDLGGDDEVRLQCGDLLEARAADSADRNGVRGEFVPGGSEVVGQTGLAVVDVADERGFEEKDGVGEAVVERDDPLGCGRDFGAPTEVLDGTGNAPDSVEVVAAAGSSLLEQAGTTKAIEAATATSAARRGKNFTDWLLR